MTSSTLRLTKPDGFTNRKAKGTTPGPKARGAASDDDDREVRAMRRDIESQGFSFDLQANAAIGQLVRRFFRSRLRDNSRNRDVKKGQVCVCGGGCRG